MTPITPAKELIARLTLDDMLELNKYLVGQIKEKRTEKGRASGEFLCPCSVRSNLKCGSTFTVDISTRSLTLSSTTAATVVTVPSLSADTVFQDLESRWTRGQSTAV